MTWREITEQMLALQGRRLFCWGPVLVSMGSAAYFSLRAEPSFLLLGGLGVFMALALMVWVCARHARWGLTYRALSGIVIAMGSGFLAASIQTHRQSPFPALPHEAVWIRGTVASVMVRAGHVVLAVRDIEYDSPWYERTEPFRRTLSIQLRDDEQHVPVSGQVIKVRALLHPPSPPFWPGGRDLQREAWFSGRAGGGMALSSPVLVSTRSVSTSGATWTRLRERLARHIQQQLPGQAGAIAATVLCGEASGISTQTRQEFAASGLAHLLAVAGLHLGIVMGGCVVLFRRLLVCSSWMALHWPCRLLACGAACVAGAVYIALTGIHIPGLRALGMAVLALLAMMVERPVSPLRLLACVALALVLVTPSLVADVSFQMSCAAVMGLLSSLEEVAPWFLALRQRGRWPDRLVEYLLLPAWVSLCTGLATLPVSMAHFGAMQPWFVLANLLAVPLMAFWVMPCGFLALFLIPFGGDSPVFHFAGWGIRGIETLAHAVANMPLASMAVPSTPSWGIALYLLGLSVLCLWRGRMRLAGLGLIGIGVLSAWLIPRPVVLVAPDYGLVAVRQAGHLMLWPRDGGVVSRVWAQDMALPHQRLPMECRRGFCRVETVAGVVLLYSGHNARFFPDLCRDVRLFVSLSRMRPLCPEVPMIDRGSVWRDGAWAAYARKGGGFSLVSDRSLRGVRPWVPNPGSEGAQGLPLAPEE